MSNLDLFLALFGFKLGLDQPYIGLLITKSHPALQIEWGKYSFMALWVLNAFVFLANFWSFLDNFCPKMQKTLTLRAKF